MTLCPLSTTLRSLHLPADANALRATALGVAVHFLESRMGAQIGPHLARVIGAIDSGQYRIFFDRYATPLAYISWAYVDGRLNGALLKDGPDALAGGGWASGSLPWVIDMFAVHGSLPAVMAFLRDEVFVGNAAVTYFRFRAQRRLAKQISRSDRSGFARGRGAVSSARGELVDNPALLHPVSEMLTSRRELGRAIDALRQGAAHRTSTLRAEPGRLNVLLTMRLARIYSRPDGRPAGLLTWAWLTPDALRRAKTHPLDQLHHSEWNEGSHLCLWELHAHPEVLPQIIADLDSGLFPQETEVWLYRPRGPQRLQRVVRSQAGAALRHWCGSAPVAQSLGAAA